MKKQAGKYIGALVAFVVFLVFGATPAALYGSYMGLTMAGALFGTPVVHDTTTTAVVTGGVVLSTVAVLSLFLVAGALVGALVHNIFRPVIDANLGRNSDKE